MQEMIAYIELVEGRTSVISDDNTCYVTHSLIQDPHLLINQVPTNSCASPGSWQFPTFRSSPILVLLLRLHSHLSLSYFLADGFLGIWSFAYFLRIKDIAFLILARLCLLMTCPCSTNQVASGSIIGILVFKQVRQLLLFWTLVRSH